MYDFMAPLNTFDGHARCRDGPCLMAVIASQRLQAQQEVVRPNQVQPGLLPNPLRLIEETLIP